MARPRVFSIPPGAPFLRTFAEALLDGRIIPGFSRARGPLALAEATIYVPTRRAARALAQEIAALVDTPATLLPHILPLGGLEETETELFFAKIDPLDDELAPAIGALHRRMILSRLILQWAQSVRHAIVSVDASGKRITDSAENLLVGASSADAWALSRDLAAMIDELIIETIAWDRLPGLATAQFDDYWRITLDFLNIAMELWPQIIVETGLIDAAERQ
jgi:ATP-dependent helicase/nuclease subunit B